MKCQDCRYVKKSKISGATLYSCYLNAPVPHNFRTVARVELHDDWPRVAYNDSCGQFRKK